MTFFRCLSRHAARAAIAVSLLGVATGALGAMSDHFVTTWNTENPGISNDSSIMVPMVGGPYDVDWDNDGVFDETGLTGAVSHDFGTAGQYTIRIQGTFDAIRFNNAGDKEKIVSLNQWGTNAWTSMTGAFHGASNLEVPATDTPNLTNVTDMGFMFALAGAANPDTSNWNVANVTDMAHMFFGATFANPDTSGWNTANVTDMRGMFTGATSANPDTSGWNVANVTDMGLMFFGATFANPDTSGWNTANVTDMSVMFAEAGAANPDTSGWNTANVTNMELMFFAASSANPDTSGWNTANVTNMRQMFSHTSSPNPDTSGWNTANVTDMNGMFWLANSANPDTSGWDTANVTDMSRMFFRASSANPDTSGWNTASVTDMSQMFLEAGSANPNTGGWDTGNVTLMVSMFTDASAANPDTSGWNTANVTSMAGMFSGASSANPDTSGWNTTNVTDMNRMFVNAGAANPDTSGWDTANVNDMSFMFFSAASANPDTSSWNTANVTNMVAMFFGATSANPDTSGWNTANVTDMNAMFAGATSANPDTSGWNTANVTDMNAMFTGATSANPDTSGWNTANVTDMNEMFGGAVSANPDVSGWDTANVTSMGAMFSSAPLFNGDVSGWDVGSVTSMRFMFDGATAFDGDLGGWDVSALTDALGMFDGVTLSTANYESLLVGWNARALQPGVIFSGGNSIFCSDAAVNARATMIADDNWTITDGGQCAFTIGGTVSGLAGSGLVLQNNGGDDLAISADGPFTFPTALTDGSSYNVTIASQPTGPSQTCTVSNASGTLNGANISDVQIDCVTDTFTIGGTVSGLAGSGLVLQNNGGDNLAISADGAFTFPTALTDGSSYNVTIASQPTGPSQTCSVSNASGNLNGANVSDVQVQCVSDASGVGLSSTTLDFGVLPEGGTASLTVTNTGTGELIISNLTDPTSPFSIVGGSCISTPVTLQPGETCSIEVAFSPNGQGGTFSASFDIESNAPSSPDTISLSGSSHIAVIPTLNHYGLIILTLLFGAIGWGVLARKS